MDECSGQYVPRVFQVLPLTCQVTQHLSTFAGSNVFQPVRRRQLWHWAVSGQLLQQSFSHDMYFTVSLIFWWYTFCVIPCRLSPSVLQGFTCSSVRRMSRRTIRQMVRACRPRRRRAKVELKESQVELSRACLKILTSNFLNIDLLSARIKMHFLCMELFFCS